MTTLALPAGMLRQTVARSYSIVLLLAGWEALCRRGAVPPVLLASVSAVAARAFVDFQDSTFLFHVGQTLIRLFSGLSIAVVLGMACGIVAAQSGVGRALLEPLVRLFAPIPKIALFPALLLIFGFDHLSRIILVLIDAIFPVLLAAYW